MSWRSSAAAIALCLASTVGTLTSASASELDRTIDLWMNEAPLTHVIHQLAEMSGGKADITGSVEGVVSGRFFGTVAQTLETLSDEHNVLFDLQDDTLHVTSKRALSEVSMVMAGADLDDSLKDSMQSGLMPGNDIEIQDDLVKLSGHPDFVKRVARRLAAELAITRAKEIEMSAQAETETVETETAEEIVQNAVLAVEESAIAELPKPVIEPLIETLDEPLEVTSTDVDIAQPETVVIQMAEPEFEEESQNAVNIVDKGAEAVLADIVDEKDTESEAVTNNESIRWVTDIPGFSTF